MSKRLEEFPLVSVIIPTYNCAPYICESIDSVLAQTYKDYEIIVVDDGSTDNTKEVLSKYKDKIRYFYQENKGVSAARNFGAKKAKGGLLIFFDDDAIAHPDFVRSHVGKKEKEMFSEIRDKVDRLEPLYKSEIYD